MDIQKNLINPIQAYKPKESALDTDNPEHKKIIEKSKEFESVFIAETLKFAKIGGMPKSNGGDTLVTDTFDGFMNKALAEGIVKQGGFGLADSIAKNLLEQHSKI